MKEKLSPGMQVEIPFGNGSRKTTGYVVELTDAPEYDVEKIKEIAEEENMPLSTVKINLKRSRSKLKKILEEEGFIYED